MPGSRTPSAPLLLLVLVLVAGVACGAPAPRAPAASAIPTSRPAPTATPRPEQVTPIGLVVLQVDEERVPPPDATQVGAGVRPTATPYATADPAWKYVTFTVAVENHADGARLLGIGGPDPQHTNLADATLTAADGNRYKPFRSFASFGLRTASARSLNNYPVLLRLPPGFRVTSESFGALTTNYPQTSTMTFRVPVAVNDYRSLAVPAMTNLGARNADDEVVKRLRPLIGAVQTLDLSGVHVGAQNVAPAAQVGNALSMGATASAPGVMSVTLTGVEQTDPTDFQARNRGWKTLTLGLRYRNDDASVPQAFSVAAWFFGDDGIVYSGDVPAIGDFGRATAVPDANIIGMWDGRTAGTDQVAPGQEQDTRRAAFQVPKALKGGWLVLAGQIEATFRVDGVGGS